MWTKREVWGFWTAAVAVAVAAVLYCSWPLGFWLNPMAEKTGLASELGAYGQPYNWLFIGADVASGALLAAACMVLWRLFGTHGWRRASLVLLLIYGACGALDAALPVHCLPSVQTCGPILHDPMLIVHGAVDFIGSAALLGTLLAEWVYARQHHRSWLPWIYIIGSGGVLFALLSLVFLLAHGPGYWAQRYYITLSCVWVASLPFVFRAQKRATL